MYAGGRALAHAASSASRGRASAGSRSSPACRWSRTAIHGTERCAAGGSFRFPKVTVQFGEPLVFDTVAEPTREQQLEVAGMVFERVRDDVPRPGGKRPTRRDQVAASRDRLARRARGPRRLASLADRRAASLVLRVEASPVLGVVPGRDHGLRVCAVKELELLQRAAPQVRVLRARLRGPPSSCRSCRSRRPRSRSRDRPGGDHAHVARRVARGEGEPDAAVAEQVEGPAEGRVGVDRSPSKSTGR